MAGRDADTLPGIGVREIGAADRDAWNAFVAAHPGSTLSHRFEWKDVCERAYGLRGIYLAADRDGELAAVFPVVRMPGLGFRPGKAVSVPFISCGDVLALEGIDQVQALRAFLDHLAGIGLREVEVRSLGSGPGDARDVTMRLDLPGDEETLWASVGPKVRNQVRKAEKSGVLARRDRGQAGVLHAIYAENMGRLGTPAHSRFFFQTVIDIFGEDADILLVELDGKPVGAMLLVRHQSVLAVPWASTLAQYNCLNPNMLMYWSALRRAQELGCNCFDFGRSSVDSGTYRFKKQWGAVAHPLDYRTFRQGMQIGTISTARYRSLPARIVREIWKLLPLNVQIVLGPLVRRRTP